MLNCISNDALKFLEEAKQSFESNFKMITYRGKDDNFIALRNGYNETIIDIYEISQPIRRFTDQLPSQYTETVLSSDVDKMKNMEEVIKNIQTVTDYYFNKYEDNEIVNEILATYLTQLKHLKK